jgi:signal transduction histidine kinase
MLVNFLFATMLIVLAVLGYFVIRHKWQEKINLIFFIFTVLAIFWFFFNFLETAHIGLFWNSLFLKLDFAFGPWLAYFFLVFSLNFPISQNSNFFRRLLILPAVIFFALALGTDFIIKDIHLANNDLYFNFGALFVTDIIYTLVYFIAGFIKWVFDLKLLTGKRRSQLLLMFCGTLLSSIILISSNLFLQNILAASFYRLIPFSLIFFIIFTSYAILKPNLFDARVVIQRSFLYSLGLGLFLSAYFGIFYLLDLVFNSLIFKNEISTFFIAGLIVIVYPRLRNIFLKKTDRFFYRFPYDSHEVSNLINRQCSLKVDYDEYFYCLSDILEKKLKISKSMLVLLKQKKIYRIYNHNFSRKLTKLLKNLEVIPNDLSIHYDRHHQKVSASELNPELNELVARHDFYRETIDKFVKFEADMFLPIYDKNVMVAFIFLGPKMSGETYYPQDLQLFDELIDRLNLAFKNIELYQEIKRYNKTLEFKVQKRTEELELQHENQIRFTADISHELQTPLAILKGNLSLINQKKITQEEIDRGFARMERSVDRLSNIIKDLIFLTKADAGKVLVNKQEFDLSQAVRSVYDDSYILAEDKRVDFQLEVLNEIKITADEDKIKSLLFNLISNALKFTPAGRKIKISLVEIHNHAVIQVEDEGTGIAIKDLPNIFSRFYRIDNPDSPKGSGLGLAICKWIVTAHGGEISVTSELGQGTIFKVVLPLK